MTTKETTMTMPTLDDSIRAIRYHAERDTMNRRLVGETDEIPPVSSYLRDLMAEVDEIENHRCDFGSDGDSLCPVCRSDPRA